MKKNNSIKIPKYLFQRQEKLRKDYLKIVKTVPGVFSLENLASSPAGDLFVEENFPAEFYKGHFLNWVFEAWSVRSILISTFNAGIKYGKNPRQWKKNSLLAKKLYEELQGFYITLDKKNYYIQEIQNLVEVGEEVHFTRKYSDVKLYKVSKQKFVKALNQLIKKYPQNKKTLP